MLRAAHPRETLLTLEACPPATGAAISGSDGRALYASHDYNGKAPECHAVFMPRAPRFDTLMHF